MNSHDRLPSTLYLVGYMSAGKSTIGRRLADLLHYTFIDTDIYLEQRFRQSVSDMFATVGEATFRKRETMLIEELLGYPQAVIATGGGLPCHDDNMQKLTSSGTTIYLQLPIDTLVAHLELCKRTRPSVRHLEGDALRQHIEAAMQVREPYYLQAHVVVSSRDVNSKEQEHQLALDIQTLLKTTPHLLHEN